MIAFLVLQIPERRRILRSPEMEKRGCYFMGSESGHQVLEMCRAESVIHRNRTPRIWECAVMGQ